MTVALGVGVGTAIPHMVAQVVVIATSHSTSELKTK